MRFAPRFIILGFVLFLVIENRAVAQQATAQLTGTVKDQTGAVVAGVKLTLKNSDTGIARETTSDKNGSYLFTLVPIGTYELSTEQKGFKTYVQKGITLDVNQNAKVDITTQLGETNEVVEVNANATQVDTVSATLGKVETGQRILDLPLGRV